VSRLATNVSQLGFVTVKKFEEPQKTCNVWAKRDTIHHFQKVSCPKIMSRFGQRVTISIVGSNSNLLSKICWKQFLGTKFRVTILLS